MRLSGPVMPHACLLVSSHSGVHTLYVTRTNTEYGVAKGRTKKQEGKSKQGKTIKKGPTLFLLLLVYIFTFTSRTVNLILFFSGVLRSTIAYRLDVRSTGCKPVEVGCCP